MLQVHTCVSVHCDRCRDALGGPLVQAHYRTEKATAGRRRRPVVADWPGSGVVVLGLCPGPDL